MSTSRFPCVIAYAVIAFGITSMLSGPVLAQDVIKVGAPLPLTGPLSPEGLKQKRGYDLWAEAANAKGIKAGGKTYKVEIVYADYASNTPRAVQTAERMITEDKVQFPVRAVRLGRDQGRERDLGEVSNPDARAIGILAGNLRPEIQIHLLDAHRQRDRLGAHRQARRRQEQGTSSASLCLPATICSRSRSRRSSRRRSRPRAWRW